MSFLMGIMVPVTILELKSYQVMYQIRAGYIYSTLQYRDPRGEEEKYNEVEVASVLTGRHEGRGQ